MWLSVLLSIVPWWSSTHFILWVLYVFLLIFYPSFSELFFMTFCLTFKLFLAFCRPSMGRWAFVHFILWILYVFFFFLSSSPSELFLSDFSVLISVAHWCTSIHFILWILYVFLHIFVLLFINVFHCFLVFLAFCCPSMSVYIFLWILLMLGYVPCKK